MMIEPINDKPGLGIATIILHNNKVLLGRRLKSPMSGSWQLPGGWLHTGESPEQVVQRKVHEFPGMQCNEAKFLTITNNLFDNGLHTVSLYFQMRCLNPDGLHLEGNEHCSDWFWADWYDLPHKLFLPLKLLKESGFKPFIDE